jgi:GNAT superfamily N-acetyltransferase
MAATKDILIRAPSQEECERLAPLLVTIAQQGTFAALDVDYAKGVANLKRWLDMPNQFVMGAWIAGQPVGTMIGFVAQQWYSQDFTAHDRLLFVSPENRGLGIGKVLAEAFDAWRLERGAKLAFINIAAGINPDAAGRTAEAAGFRHVGPIFMKGN